MFARSILSLLAAMLVAVAPIEGQGTAEASIAEARAHLAAGRTAEAIVAFEAAARADPGNAPARNALGSLLNSSGRYAEALPHAEAAVALDPANGRYRYNRGVVLAEHGRFAEAVADFDLAIAAHPDLTYAYLERGAAFISLGRAEEARRDWEKARLGDPDLIWTIWYPATLQVLDGEYAAAAAIFDQVAAAQPGFLPAALWSAVAHGRAGRWSAPAAAGGDWPGPILDFYRGAIDAQRLLEIAAQDEASGDRRRVGEALYFIGQRELIAGRRQSAADHFRRATEIAAPRHIWKMSAERELCRLTDG